MRLIISLIFIFNMLYGLDALNGISDIAQESISDSKELNNVYQSIQKDEAFVSDLEKIDYQKIAKDNLAPKPQKPKKIKTYFENIEKVGCGSYKDLTCPPLKKEYEKSLSTRITSIDPLSGRYECSVFRIINSHNSGDKLVHKANFTNRDCISKFNEKKKLPDEVKQLITTIEESKVHETLLIDKNKYLKDFKSSEHQQYLDFADLSDALFTLDPSIINIQETLKLGQLNLYDNYTIVGDDVKIDEFVGDLQNKIRKIAQEYFQSNHISNLNPFDAPEIVSRSYTFEERAKQLSNNEYVSFLRVIQKAEKLLSPIVFYIFFAAAVFHIFFEGIIYTSNTWKKESKDYSTVIIHKLATGLFLVYFTLSPSVEHRYEDTDKYTIVSKTTRFQEYIRWGVAQTNLIADQLAEIEIDAFMQKIGIDLNIIGINQLKNIEIQSQKLNAENKILQEIENQCYIIYNTPTIISKLEEKSDNKNYLLLNSFPASETQATMLLKDSPQHPYSDNKISFVNNKYYEKNGFQNAYSLSACHNIVRQKLLNFKQIEENQKTLENIKHALQTNTTKDRLILSNSLIWRAYAEFGYLSTTFLPALEVSTNLSQLAENKKEAILSRLNSVSSSSNEVLRWLIQDAVYLYVFNGSSLSSILTNMVDGFVGWIPVFGGIIKSVSGVVSKLIVAESIKVLLDIAVYASISISAMLAFGFTYLQKLFMILTSLFFILVFVMTNDKQKASHILSNFIYIIVKPVILTLLVFIVPYVYHFVMKLLGYMNNNVVDITAQLNGAVAEGVSYGYEGFAVILIQLICIIMGPVSMFKIPGYLSNMISININDLTDEFLNVIQQPVAHKVRM